jgi:uncharacterized protein YbjQ (UPF0145 family)
MNYPCNTFAICKTDGGPNLILAHHSRREKPMTNVMSITFLIVSLATVSPLHARDTRHLLPIAAALETKDAQDKLEGSVKFFFGEQPAPQILTKLGSDVANRKTNAFGKSDDKACNWAFLSALVALEKRAQQLSANAVVNVVSYYNRKVMSSITEFECHAGAIIAGVVLKGDFVKIGD